VQVVVMSAAKLASIVGTLIDMDLIDLDEPGPWPGEPEGYSVHAVDWSAVNGSSGLEDAVSPVGRGDILIDEIRERASQGFHAPPEQVLDAQAWYLPIHYYGPASAIYISEQSCMWLAACIMRNLPRHRWDDLDAVEGCIRAALSLLYLHEAFHHKVESLAIRLEAVERVRRYLPYHRNVYAPLQRAQSDELLEEALACAEMYRRFESEKRYRRGVPADVRAAILKFLPGYFESLPAGYNRAMDFVYDLPYFSALRVFHSQIHEATKTPVRDDLEWQLAGQMLRGLMDCRSITHVIVPIGSKPILPWVGEQLALPQVSTREAVRLAERRGWKIVPGGGKGSHLKMKRPGFPTLTLSGGRKALSPVVLDNFAAGLGVRVHDITTLLRES